MSRTLVGIVLACALATAVPPRAHAEDTYEWARTQKLLDDEGLTPAPQPDGKHIAWVRVVRDNIFMEDELWPTWANRFHRMTRDEVVRRELLFEPGEPFAERLVEETMRNLRSMGIFALVRIVAVQTDDPSRVGVVVHTRDLWSLRLEQQLSIDRRINLLRLVLAERNLAGKNGMLEGDFLVLRDKYVLSEGYTARRVRGSDIRLSQSMGIILGRFRPGAEGSLGSLEVSKPYYRLSQRLSWEVAGAYDARVTRQLSDATRYVQHELPSGDVVNGVFDDRRAAAYALVSGRFGDELKMTIGGGISYWERRTRANSESGVPDGQDAAFRAVVLPLQRRDVGPRIYYDMFLARYRTLTNLSTFGQSENVRVGPHVAMSLYAPLQALGSRIDALVVRGVLEGTTTLGNGLASLSLDGTSRLQRGTLIDQRLLAQVRVASPYVGPLRLVGRLALDARLRDSQRTFVSLGSSAGLRGYQAYSFTGAGASRVLLNVELRTLPLKIRSVRVGGVVFYDTGSVYRSLNQVELHHAVGVGLRVVFPQFNRTPFSFDLGFPVGSGLRLTPQAITPTVNSGQSVPVTDLDEDLFVL